MTRQLGIAVTTGELRAVLAEGAQILWRGARSLQPGEQMGDAIAALLRDIPRAHLRSARVIAAIGPAMSQVKKLGGLPATIDQPSVQQLLRTNPQRFFLGGDGVQSLPVAYRNGVWWGAVFRASVVSEIERGCAGAKLKYLGCVPGVTAMAAVCQPGAEVVHCQDGALHISIALRDGVWTDIRRERTVESRETTVAGTQQLGDEAHVYSAAYAAARSSARSPLLLRATREASRPRLRRFVLLGIAAAIALGGALAGPGIRAQRDLSLDTARLTRLEASAKSWRPAANRLTATAAALDEIDHFAGDRRSVVQLLGGISRALPESTAIVSLRMDSAAVNLTILATNAAAVVARFNGITEFEDARIAGALTRENVAGVSLQRVAVRFRLKRADSGAP
jgi:hypothetical protein